MDTKEAVEARKAKARDYNLKNWWKHLLGGIGLLVLSGFISTLFTNGLVTILCAVLYLAGLIGLIAGIINGIRSLFSKSSGR